MNGCAPRARLAAPLIPVVETPSAAHAHLTNTGLGPFYDGLAHPFPTADEVLPVLARSLFAGLRGTRFGQTVLVACRSPF